jgi:hypothetical protein
VACARHPRALGRQNPSVSELDDGKSSIRSYSSSHAGPRSHDPSWQQRPDATDPRRSAPPDHIPAELGELVYRIKQGRTSTEEIIVDKSVGVRMPQRRWFSWSARETGDANSRSELCFFSPSGRQPRFQLAGPEMRRKLLTTRS